MIKQLAVCAWIECVLYKAKYGYIIHNCRSEIVDFWINHSTHLWCTRIRSDEWESFHHFGNLLSAKTFSENHKLQELCKTSDS